MGKVPMGKVPMGKVPMGKVPMGKVWRTVLGGAPAPLSSG